jgi:hypothetical protein
MPSLMSAAVMSAVMSVVAMESVTAGAAQPL